MVGWRGRRDGIRGAVPLAATLLIVALAGLLAFQRLGFGPAAATALIGAIGLGGAIDVPLTGRRGDLNGPVRRPEIGVNVGGCLIPLAIAGDRAARLPTWAWGPLLGAVVLVALVCFATARPVAGRGIVLPWMLPGLLGAALGLSLVPARAAAVAYVAGVVGPLLGAELPHLRRLAHHGAARAGIGGAGAFDGLLWSGLLAACMAVGH